MDRTVYLDNAATTMTDPRVVEAMLPYMYDMYGNASGKYSKGFEARKAVEEAREKVAHLIGAKSDEIYFTSGATEGNNMVFGENTWPVVITPKTEHKSVLNAADAYSKRSRYISLGVDDEGFIFPDSLEECLKDTYGKVIDRSARIGNENKGLVSIMYTNNETGTRQLIDLLTDSAHEYGYLFHTDAVQALGHIKVNVKDDDIDYLTASGHKLYGPKGIGFIYIRRGLPLHALMYGGEQEKGIRPGTENVPGIVGLGEACRIAEAEMHEYALKERINSRLLRDALLKIPESRQNGTGDRILNISFNGVNGQSLAMRLDMEGICVSTGSACSSGLDERSHVLVAMGLTAKEADSSIRISLGKYNTVEEIEYAAAKISYLVEELRFLSGEYPKA